MSTDLIHAWVIRDRVTRCGLTDPIETVSIDTELINCPNCMESGRITDFLLSRIAEDEELARGILARPGSAANGSPSYPFDPARILIECAVKRAIVKDCADILNVSGRECDGALELADMTTRCLAAVYSGHSEYIPEWKVA